MEKTVRQSNFELLRIVAMFFIVLYHLLLESSARFGIADFRTLWLPLHMGVILFVFISGYFNIRPTCKGVLKLLLPVFILPLVINVCYRGFYGNGGRSLTSIFLLLEQTPYWFIRTYFVLFLLSPLINGYLCKASKQSRIYILCALGFLAVYLGMRSDDPSLTTGKNIVNFFFLYTIGDSIRHYQERIRKIPTRYILVSFLLLNAVVMSAYHITQSELIYNYSFGYCSPILIFNSVLFFLLFERINIQSRTINYISASVFTTYIFHCDYTILHIFIVPWVGEIYWSSPSSWVYILTLIGVDLVIMTIGLGLNAILSPIVNYICRKCDKVIKRYNLN